ncbi:hypothetical protein LTR97_002304 [Elasticomyces elasticus]|uniref:RING-type domain-containing protein n=1 Tax=Elasticomyces elasticus TaxID=574655 RepID=A0AAN7WHI0_9PEZI|nr:hypothetical protein LTR97_002304 [Elasticomyces elasticus]
MPKAPGLFNLRHAVHLVYPSVPNSLKDWYTILPVHNAESRYSPQDALVDDDVVRDRTVLSKHSVRMFSHTDAISIGRHEMVAAYRKLKPMNLRSVVRLPGPERLVNDMKRWMVYNGGTRLDIATYQKDDMVMRIWIKLSSWLTLDHGATMQGTERYDMTLAEFEAITSTDLWYANALDLIRQRSDRAVRHVRLQMQWRGLESKNPSEWKPRSLTDYMIMGNDLVIEDLESVAEDECCPICQMSFDASNNFIPLRLRCHPKHTICDDCYITWAGTSKTVGCPHCRARMFSDEELAMLIYGLDPDGKTYNTSLPNNARFPDAWETFQRANVDLDTYKLLDDGIRNVHLQALLLTKVWEHIIEGALLESPDSSPLHLQAGRFPETTFITAVIRDVFDEFEGQTCSSPHELITEAMVRRLNAEFRKSSTFAVLTRAQQKKMKYNHMHSVGPHSSGLFTFLSRTLCRTLEFVQRRDCSDSAECSAFHFHGERAFYNPNLLEDLEDE